MEEKDYKFNINGTEIIIKVDVVPPNQVIVPIYKPTTEIILGFSGTVSEKEFLTDIEKLLPKKVDNTFFDYIIDTALFETIQSHLNKFGRLTDSDMELYVGETLLVLTAVAKSMRMELPTDEDKTFLFDHLSKKISHNLQ